MAFKFPFTNYHELNLTWVLEQLKKLFEDSEENVETIESYENRLSAVETELPVVEATANQAETVANAAATLAQTAKNTADTANENALTASAQAGLARQEAATAEAEAQAATQAAQQVQATVQDFDGRITQAEDDASEALQEAQSFENRVNAAINTANNAANTATIAQGIAVNANQNAATALDTAQTADGKAEAAQDAADIADGKAEAAQDAADIADGKAEAAQDAADIADGKAEAAQDTADLADEKADTNAANIGNLSNLTTTAKNNLVAAINEAAQSGGSGDNTNCAPIIINTASGDVATFTDGADNRQIRKIVGTIVTPEGESGRTGANVFVRGKNLFDDTIYSEYEQEDGSFVASGGTFSLARFYIPSGLIGKQLTFSAYLRRPDGSNITNIRVQATVNGVVQKGNIVASSNYTLSSITFTPETSNDNVTLTYGNNGGNMMQAKDLQLEFGSAVTDFEAYHGQTLAINWQTEAGAILNGTVTLNADGSADVVDSGTGNSYHLANIESLYTYLGTNNVWIDTGVITECNYPADTKLYIDKKIAELQALILEN